MRGNEQVFSCVLEQQEELLVPLKKACFFQFFGSDVGANRQQV